jgi:hypothetical protein
VARIPENFPDDMILLGGHIANDLTSRFLKEYCPGFGIYGRAEDSPDEPVDSIWYGCGRREFIDSDQDAWAFIAKISVDVTRSPRTVVMVWGRSSFGSTSAAHFVANRASMLKIKRDQSIFWALRMSRQLHYQSLPMETIELTDQVFGAAAQGASPPGGTITAADELGTAD